MGRNHTIAPLSWEKLDPDYADRGGYDRDFLRVRVLTPKLSDALKPKPEPTIDVLAYEHFSVQLNPDRKLAFWTAVNIDGSKPRRLGDRAADVWWFDEREDDLKPYQTGNKFYTGSGFQRGHLVRRLDPAWGDSDTEAARGEADSFHWTNCSPQIPALNTQWWAKVENHVLDTADAANERITVFSGCVFTSKDPTYRSLKIPLAFWKVVAWTVGKSKPSLRSLAFVVKQDEAVAKLLKLKGVQPLAVDLADVPSAIQGYQTTVAALEKMTGIAFGGLSKPSVDVYAAKRKTCLLYTSPSPRDS